MISNNIKLQTEPDQQVKKTILGKKHPEYTTYLHVNKINSLSPYRSAHNPEIGCENFVIILFIVFTALLECSTYFS